MSSKTIWDAHGSRIGEDVITTDQEGLAHIAHYDNHNSLVVRSYETRDHKGEVYIIHEDARGNRLGRSTVERDWWGEYYVKTEETIWQQRQAEAEQQNGRDNSECKAGGIGDILCGVVMFLVKIFAFLLLGSFLYGILGTAGATIWAFLLMPLLNQSSHLSQTGPTFIVLLASLWLSYVPYVGILLHRRWKKKIYWKDFFFFVLRWAVIGPFAYRKLVRQMRAEKLPRTGMPDPEEAQNICLSCGYVSAREDRFCKQCGAKLYKPY